MPRLREPLVRAAARGYNRAAIACALQRHQQDSIGELRAEGVTEAHARNVPYPNAVRLALKRCRNSCSQPPVAVTPPEHLQRREVIVTPRALSTYR